MRGSPLIHTAVADYYTRALEAHGPSPRGVDWSSRESQELRFGVLLESLDLSTGRTLLDYGCGYGALTAYLDEIGAGCEYVGYDISPAMIDAARAEHPGRHFTTDSAGLETVDYVVASGIFNVKLDISPDLWERYVEETLAAMAELARRALCFNMLPPASLPELARDDLYYDEPEHVSELCASRLGGAVSLRQRYGLWEFTVQVRFG